MYDHIELPIKYKLGHENIDNQHAQLFACLLDMQSIIKNEDKKNIKQIEDAANEVLRFLRSYAQNHFYYEEALMKRNHNPELENHQKLHCEFIQTIIDLQVKGNKEHKSKIIILGEVSNYVKGWYLNHILSEDRKIVAFECSLSSSTKK